MSDHQIINDAIMGTHRISEPVLIDLIHSKAIRRLMGIHQAGGSFLTRPGRDVTRYEHAIGVMLLIRTLGGSIEEQVAGLLHDVSHTAFSHVIDQVFDRPAEDYHDSHFEQFVSKSDIPSILARHGMTPEIFFDLSRWTLLEQPKPDLCADRIDYTLRDLLRLGHIKSSEMRRFLESLRVHEGKIVTISLGAAVWFVEQYTTEVHDLFMHPLEIYGSGQLAQAIRAGLDHGLLQENDLFLQDDDVLARLQDTHNPDVQRHLKHLRFGNKVVEDEEHYDTHSVLKARIVDPLVLLKDGRLLRCSVLEPSVLLMHEKVILKAEAGVYVRRLN